MNSYTTTVSKTKTSFAKISSQLFRGILDIDDLELEIDPLDTEVGFCIEDENGKIILGLTDKFESKKQFEDVLCHEMIHLWQIMNCWKVHHGDSFQDYAKKALKFGYSV